MVGIVELSSEVGQLLTLSEHVPSQIKRRFGEAVSELLADLAGVPSAWLEAKRQGIIDTKIARSATSKAYTAAVIAELPNSAADLEAAKLAYTPSVVRRVANKAKIAVEAADLLKSPDADLGSGDPRDDDKVSLDLDWLSKFLRHSEDASSERLQLLFAKVLAGEVVRPGTFSLTTLRVLSELTTQLAEDFTLEWNKSFEDMVPFTSLYNGPSLNRIVRLQDAGFVSNVNLSMNRSDLTGNTWTIGDAENCLKIDYNSPPQNPTSFLNPHSIEVVKLTSVGMQIGSLLPKRNTIAACRRIAEHIEKDGIVQIRLCAQGETEIVYPKSAKI